MDLEAGHKGLLIHLNEAIYRIEFELIELNLIADALQVYDPEQVARHHLKGFLPHFIQLAFFYVCIFSLHSV